MDDFGDDTRVVLITFTDQVNLSDYRASLDVPFPLLTDPTRSTYRRYGLGRGSARRVWGTKAARAYAGLLRKGGRKLKMPTEDTLQLGGDFVIDRQGRIAFAYRSAGPDDRPPVEDLLVAVDRVRRR